MNEFQFLQWFLSANFEETLKSVAASVVLANSNLTQLTQRIDKMEEIIKTGIDELKAGIVADSEQKAKVLAEIKDTMKKLADANAGGQAAIDAAVAAAKAAQAAEDKAAADAANAEVVAALAEVKAQFQASADATKVLDEQIPDLAPAQPPVTPAV
jgi:hypothetical protein